MTTRWRRQLIATVWLVGFAGVAGGALAAESQGRAPEVKPAPYSAIPSVAGKDNFDAYCAVCHGLDAKGKGPAAPAMKAQVPDLTALRKKDGKFDAAAVEYVIRGTGKTATPAHGTTEMPVWGVVFASPAGQRAGADVRIRNLVQYIESVQQTR